MLRIFRSFFHRGVLHVSYPWDCSVSSFIGVFVISAPAVFIVRVCRLAFFFMCPRRAPLFLGGSVGTAAARAALLQACRAPCGGFF